MFKNLNLLFVFSFILILGIISSFNYIVDPYNIIFDRPPELNLSRYDKDLFAIVLKQSVKSNYNTMTFGGSSTSSFINRDFFPKNHAMLNSGYMVSDTLLNYVKFFVKNHPELKTVIFNIEYASYYFDKKDLFPEIKSSKLTIQEIARLFLSVDTTISSIKKLKKDPKKIFNKTRYKNKQHKYQEYFNREKLFNNDEITNKTDAEDIEYNVFIKRNNNHYMKGLKKDILEHFEEYINFFEENNVNVIYIFPAYHAMLQSKIYKDFDYKDIENIKRLFATKAKGKVLDFAYINKYTTEDLDKTYLYVDLIHPYSYKYNFFYCTLNNLNAYKDKNVYVELTKDNIEDILSEQRKNLEKYITQNNKQIDTFLSYRIDNYPIQKFTRNAPDCRAYSRL